MNDQNSIADNAPETQEAPTIGMEDMPAELADPAAIAAASVAEAQMGAADAQAAPIQHASQGPMTDWEFEEATDAVFDDGTTPNTPRRVPTAQERLDRQYGHPFVVVALDPATAAVLRENKIRVVECGDSDEEPFGFIAKDAERASLDSAAMRLPQDRLDPRLEIDPFLTRSVTSRDVLVLGTLDPQSNYRHRDVVVAARHLARSLVVQGVPASVRVAIATRPRVGAAEHAGVDGSEQAEWDGGLADMDEDWTPPAASKAAFPSPRGATKGWNAVDAGAWTSAEQVVRETLREAKSRDGAHPTASFEFLFEASNLPEVEAGYLFCGVYASAMVQDEGAWSAMDLLIRRPHTRGNERPAIQFQKMMTVPDPSGSGKGAKQKTMQVVGWSASAAPYLHRVRTLTRAPRINGRLELNDPRNPPKVFAEYRGVTDDGRPLTIVSDGVLTQEYLCGIGFSCNQQTHAVWKDAERVLAGQVPRVMATDVTGWVLVPKADGSFDHDNDIPQYVHGGRVIAPKGANVPELVSTRVDHVGRSTSRVGSFENWKRANELALRNSLFAVVAGAVASSALLGVLPDLESMLIHIVGDSGVGKTQALRILATMIGSGAKPGDSSSKSMFTSWVATDNGAIAAKQEWNDCTTFKDEIDESKEVKASTIYAEINGTGKLRAHIDGSAKATISSRGHTMSAGEASIAAKLMQSAKAARDAEMTGGLQFRCVEPAADRVWDDVMSETADGGLGVYAQLVGEQTLTSVSAAGQAIDALVAAAHANHGHFWDHWIAFLQTREGLAKVRQWAEENVAFTASFVRPSDSSIAKRRAKHVVAALTGLRGVLHVCGYPAQTAERIFAGAQAAARDHFWLAGLDSRNTTEAQDYAARAEAWIVNNEARFYAANRPTPEGSLGWIKPPELGGDGTCVLMNEGLAELAQQLGGIDKNRLRAALVAAGWESTRGERHPRLDPLTARESAAPRVLRKVRFFDSRNNAASNANKLGLDDDEALAREDVLVGAAALVASATPAAHSATNVATSSANGNAKSSGAGSANGNAKGGATERAKAREPVRAKGEAQGVGVDGAPPRAANDPSQPAASASQQAASKEGTVSKWGGPKTSRSPN